MKRNKLLVILLSVLMMFSFTMCESKTMYSYNPYSERYGISSDEDLKKAMQSMKENEDYPILQGWSRGIQNSQTISIGFV